MEDRFSIWQCTACRDDLVIKAGSEAGAMLVDGLGDGVMLEAADHDFDFLRTTSFGMLQGCRMRNTKTVSSQPVIFETHLILSSKEVKKILHNNLRFLFIVLDCLPHGSFQIAGICVLPLLWPHSF